MERKEIFNKLTDIFRDVLDNEEVVVSDSTCADDIEEWDSLAQIQLTVAIEKAFGIKFKSTDIVKWQNVGQMVDSIINLL